MRVIGILALAIIALAAPRTASACTFFDQRHVARPADHPGDHTPPGPVQHMVVTAQRGGMCYGIASITLRFRPKGAGLDVSGRGYRVEVVGGRIPPSMPRRWPDTTATDGRVTVHWVEPEAEMRLAFEPILALSVVDRAGNVSAPIFAQAHLRPTRPLERMPDERPDSTAIWLIGLIGLAIYGVGRRRARVRWAMLAG